MLFKLAFHRVSLEDDDCPDPPPIEDVVRECVRFRECLGADFQGFLMTLAYLHNNSYCFSRQEYFDVLHAHEVVPNILGVIAGFLGCEITQTQEIETREQLWILLHSLALDSALCRDYMIELSVPEFIVDIDRMILSLKEASYCVQILNLLFDGLKMEPGRMLDYISFYLSDEAETDWEVMELLTKVADRCPDLPPTIALAIFSVFTMPSPSSFAAALSGVNILLKREPSLIHAEKAPQRLIAMAQRALQLKDNEKIIYHGCILIVTLCWSLGNPDIGRLRTSIPLKNIVELMESDSEMVVKVALNSLQALIDTATPDYLESMCQFGTFGVMMQMVSTASYDIKNAIAALIAITLGKTTLRVLEHLIELDVIELLVEFMEEVGNDSCDIESTILQKFIHIIEFKPLSGQIIQRINESEAFHRFAEMEPDSKEVGEKLEELMAILSE